MAQIIAKKPDGGILITDFNTDRYGNDKSSFEDLEIVKFYISNGYEWFLSDQVINKSNLESRKQLYHDGNSVKVDTDWSIRLMPDQLIKRKHLNRLNKKIDEELKKESPCAITLARLQRSHSICKDKKAGRHNEDHFWSELALENLDSRVTGGESDKPKIREKLQAKIEELKNAAKK